MRAQPPLFLAKSKFLAVVLCASLPAFILLLSAGGLLAADVTWTGGLAGTGTTWLGTTNWDSGIVPGSADNAVFDAAGTANTITIQMTTAGGLQRVGSVTLSGNNFADRTIRNNSTTRGTLELGGVGGILLANYSGAALTLQNASGSSQPMDVRLANSGTIHVAYAPTTAQIVISSSIGEINGSQGFTKTGPGILYLQGTNNTFTGSITNVGDSWVKVNSSATFGAGIAPIYLNGDFGGIISGADRSGGAPLSNPIVINGNCFIKNDGGTTGTSRTLPFSGPLLGNSGSLTIANMTPVMENTFSVRLLGSFTFGLPLTIGSFADTVGSYSILQLYHSATNGTQIFNGVISGPGSVRRQGVTSSPGGTTIFTADNTYSGGTLVTYGTLLVNNTVGTGTGTGSVIVTNQGVLGGFGSAGSTVVSLGGTIAPGVTVSNMSVSDLTLGEGGNYAFQVGSATGTPGTSWDVIRVGGGGGVWTDAATSANPFTIKLDSMGVAPAGWSSGVAREWVIIDGGTASGFDLSHFTLDTTSFAGGVQGIFSLSATGGDLRLVYTPAADIIINVPSGTQTQAAAGYSQLSGPFGLVKAGNGELVLNNSANDYAGSTKIYAGTVSLAVDAMNGSGALGSGSTAVLLGHTTGSSNAMLNINTAGVTAGRSITVQSGSSGTKSIATSVGSGVGVFSGDITLQDNVTLSAVAGGEASFAGQLTGAGGVVKSGAGIVTLSGLNTFSGATTLSNGTFNLNNRAGSGTFIVAGVSTIDNTAGASVTLVNTSHVWNADFVFTGTTNLNLGSAPVTLGGSRILTVGNSTLTVGGPILEAAPGFGFTKLGAGTLALTTTSASSYSGDTILASGLTTIGGSTTFGDGTGTLRLTGGNLMLTGTRNTTTGIIPNPINMSADTIIQNTTTAAAGTRNLPFGGVLSGSAGTLTIRNMASANTNVMHVRLHVGGINFGRPIVFDNSLAGSAVYNTCQLGLYNTNGSADQVFSGTISGPGVVLRTAVTAGTGGTSILSGQNTHTLGTTIARGFLGLGSSSVAYGGVVVSGPVGTGTLEIQDDTVNGLAGVGIFAYDGARTLHNRVWLNGPATTLIGGTHDLTFAGSFDVGGVTKTIVVSNTAVTTIAGLITNSAALVKAGPGRLVITADNSLRTNTTAVTEGLLLANNTMGSATGSGAVIVSDAGILGGTGSVSGLVSGDGSVAPGASAGTLTLGGGLDLSGGGALLWDLAANSTSNPGTDFDVLAVTGGGVTLGGTSKLVLSFINPATAPDISQPFWQTAHSWKILSLSGTASNGGLTAFPTILNGTYGAGTFTNYANATGDIILEFKPSAVPPQPQITSITGAGTASTTLSWTAVNGLTYTVEYKTNLTQVGWLSLGTAPGINGSATITDNTGPHPQRYYRITWP